MRTLALLCVLALGPGLGAADADKPVPTKDAAAGMTVPDGFKVTLFAGEPDVVQPIAFAFDDRGRMWVIECLMYPKWSQDGKGGKDRVVILEDTDGDGTFDKKTVVIENGVNLSGIELGFGGVYLCSSPNLIFVPIKDDKPAGPPEVLLDGWNIKDAKHNVFNGLVWGPDGWLYGCNGIQTKSKVGRPGTPDKDRVLFDCGVWRFHPTRKVFEVVANGTTNPWGLDFDEHGEMFITNCVIDHLFHIVPGGHYERMYGQDPNPHTYGLMKSCVDYRHWAGGDWTSSRSTGPGGKPEHSDFGGGHAHSGAAIYLADNFPKEYRNTLFTANIHGNRLNNDGLERTESGMKGVRRPDFLFANDSWFRGICVKVGPEGGLYVSDWCDTGECHNYDKADITNGRIYRVVYKVAKQWKGDISKLSDAELVKLQLHPNDWFVRKARRVLQERAAAGKLEKETPDALRALLKDEKDAPKRLRALWVLFVIGKVDTSVLSALMADKDEVLRAAAFRFGCQGDQLLPLLRDTEVNVRMEQSPFVLSAVASAIQHLPSVGAAHPLVMGLQFNEVVKRDPYLSQLFWYGVERHFTRDLTDAFSLYSDESNQLVRRNAIRVLLAQPDQSRRIEWLLGIAGDARPIENGVSLDILATMRESLAGKKLDEPKKWAAVYAKVNASGSPALRRASAA
ncbi:MAG: dehydrogenase, partial [Gemmataceae bacterium]|nr:dehydrogenase [Gemmataceae bacterium]